VVHNLTQRHQTFHLQNVIFRFLSTGDEVFPGNNNMKGQVLALCWVQKNNSQFGGDPHNVTIGGMRAGGGSVYLHVSPMSEGVNRIIPSDLKMQSAGPV